MRKKYGSSHPVSKQIINSVSELSCLFLTEGGKHTIYYVIRVIDNDFITYMISKISHNRYINWTNVTFIKSRYYKFSNLLLFYYIYWERSILILTNCVLVVFDLYSLRYYGVRDSCVFTDHQYFIIDNFSITVKHIFPYSVIFFG